MSKKILYLSLGLFAMVIQMSLWAAETAGSQSFKVPEVSITLSNESKYDIMLYTETKSLTSSASNAQISSPKPYPLFGNSWIKSFATPPIKKTTSDFAPAGNAVLHYKDKNQKELTYKFTWPNTDRWNGGNDDLTIEIYGKSVHSPMRPDEKFYDYTILIHSKSK